MSVWRSIKKRVNRLIPSRSTPDEETQTIRIPVHLCRHFCGFRYGCDSFNPYENYIVGLSRGVPERELQLKFEEFILWNRPRNFAELLGIPIDPSIPLWSFPWGPPAPKNTGWHLGLNELPDILTHFCEEGVKRSRMTEEYLWLRRAYESIKQNGYRPDEHNYITVVEMTDGVTNCYVLEDGNHRLSALVALDVKEVLVQYQPSKTVSLVNVHAWRQVKGGHYQAGDAERVLRAYLQGVNDFPRSSTPATILDA